MEKEKIMKKLLILLLWMGSLQVQGQYLDSIQAKEGLENIQVIPLQSDSLASSFVIFIRKEVPAHYHAEHSEHVVILEGEGTMLLGDSTFRVKKGDMIFIPKGTVHAFVTTSSFPAKVLSIQAPRFTGKDRIPYKP